MLSDIVTPGLDLTVCIGLLLLMIVCYGVWYKQSLRGLPPFPTTPLPVVGNIWSMEKNSRLLFKKWRKRCGDIFSLYLGQSLVIVLNGHDTIKEALCKNKDELSDRPTLFFDEYSGYSNLGIATASGPVWREERTMAVAILKSFGKGSNVLAERVSQELHCCVEHFAKLKGKPTEINSAIHLSVSNVFCSIIFGKRFDYDDKELARILSLFNDQISCLSHTAVVNFFPQLVYVPGDIFKAQHTKSIISNYISLFNEYVRNVGEVNENTESTSYITAYLKEKMRKEKAGEQTTMTEMTLTKSLSELFIAGVDTTMNTLLWWILYLIRNPRVQSKAFDEIKNEIGLERSPTLQDKVRMKYVTAMMMETMRLASVVPLSLFHCCTKEVKIRGYRIPKGALVSPNLDSVLHDEAIWGLDPDVFRPERFLDDEDQILRFEEFIPFSLGKRACPGESFAHTELFLYMTSLLQRFQFMPADANNLPSMEGVFGLTCHPQPFQVRLVERA